MTESTTPRTDALLESLDVRKATDEAGSCALILHAQQLEEELTAQKVSLSETQSALAELHAMVWGECPSLLNEDSGGCGRLDIRIRNLLPGAPK